MLAIFKAFYASSLRANSWVSHALTIGLHLLLLAACYSGLYCFGLINTWPDRYNLLSWDASVFRDISQTGYPDAARGHNAFFPLLPLIWRFTGLNGLGISLFNATCACAGTLILAQGFRLSAAQLLLVLSAPLMMFTLVPYGEVLLFLFASLMLVGLHRQHLVLTLIGLAGCCLTRSAATLFVPAYLFAELLTAAMPAGSWRRAFRNLGLGLLVMAGVLLLVMWMQYRQHGDWFAFYKVHALWGQVLGWPNLPMFDSAGINMMWLDGTGLLIALLSATACLVLGILWLVRLQRRRLMPPISKAVLFAVGYATGAGFFIVFYQGGDIVGASRYLLATPFFAVLLWQLWRSETPAWKIALALGSGSLLVAWQLGFPAQVANLYPAEACWYFALATAYVLATALAPRSCWEAGRQLAGGLYVVNLVMLSYLLSLFIDGIWVN